ncbi:MAG: hypothetical protein ACRDV1_08085 [Actinomycetes bacterium]
MSSSTTGRGGGAHLDIETLADLQEELLPPPEAAAAATHLAGCASCRSERAGLDRVRAALEEAGDVGPMPADVAARLDSALTASPDAPGAVGASRTVTPLQRPVPRTSRSTRLLQAAAVLVLLLAGGAIGVSAFVGERADQVAGSADGAAEDAAPKAAPGEFPVISSGTDYTADSVVTAVPRLLASTSRTRLNAPQEYSTDAGAEASDLRGGKPLADCVTNLAEGPVTPVGVDLAEFNGRPAAVIVLPTPGDPTHVDVYAVEPSCPRGNFLHFARVARP